MSDIVITGFEGTPAPGYGCVMQHVVRDLLNITERIDIRDCHPCLNATVNVWAIHTNDALSVSERQDLVAFIPRLVRCRACADFEVEARINDALGEWIEIEDWAKDPLGSLDKLIDQWEKTAADEGALGNLKPLT